MTIDEAIRHCEEVAEQKDHESFIDRWSDDDEWSESVKEECRQCAADHRQLAEWLTDYKKSQEELAEAKRLLKAAINDLIWLTRYHDPCELCAVRDDNGDCPVNGTVDCDDVYKWQYTDEALKLIGDESDGI